MKLVYLAGPFRSKKTPYSYWEQDQNCNEAAKVALELWRMGFSVICPHLNTRPFQGALRDSVWLDGDMEQVRRADAVVLMPKWQLSEGTKLEVAEALARRKPIYVWDHTVMDAWGMKGKDSPDTPPWLGDFK